jgi:hypothetical protein
VQRLLRPYCAALVPRVGRREDDFVGEDLRACRLAGDVEVRDADVVGGNSGRILESGWIGVRGMEAGEERERGMEWKKLAHLSVCPKLSSFAR